jgi:RNA processing factor Prp31
MARKLAAKVALASRIDALKETGSNEMGIESRAVLEKLKY